MFLYDGNLNVLLYEVNRNGCFLNNIIEIYNNETIDDEDKYSLEFLAVVRKAEYERFLNMYYIKEFELDIAEPRAVLRNSRYRRWNRSCIEKTSRGRYKSKYR